MKSTLWVAALLAAATISSSAFAHGGGHDDWRGHQWREHRHHQHGHLPPPPPVYRGHEHPRHHDHYWRSHAGHPVAYREVPILLPPSPHEVHRAIRDSLFGR